MKLEALYIDEMLRGGPGVIRKYIQPLYEYILPLYEFNMSIIEILNNKVTNNE